MAKRHWLAVVDIAGVRLRLGTDAVAPVATLGTEEYAAGDGVHHDPSLAQPTVSWRCIPGSDDAIGESDAQVAFQLPGDLSLAAAWAQGQPIHRARVELSIWYEGTPYEARYIVALGYLEVDDFALAGETVSGSIEPCDPMGTDTIPSPNDGISDATLDGYTIVSSGVVIGFSMPDDVTGAPYPFPLGRAGLYVDETGVESDVPSTPALLITQAAASERLLVSGRPVGATSVTIYNANPANALAPTTASFAIDLIQDINGQPLATVHPTTGTWKYDGSETFYCAGWTDAIQTDNGLYIRGLGDVILYLLRSANTGAVFALGEWAAVAGALNSVEVGGYFDESIEPWTLITEQLLQLYPRCRAIAGPRGVTPVVFEDIPPDQCFELVEGYDFDLPDGGRPTYATDDVYSAVRVEYALNAATGNYLGLVAIGPQTDNQDESGASMSLRSYSWSEGNDGKPTRETRTIQSAWLWRHDSAGRVATDRLLLDQERLPSITVVLMDDSRWLDLPLGLAVRTTSSTLTWDGVPMWVCGVTLGAIDEVELLARPRT